MIDIITIELVNTQTTDTVKNTLKADDLHLVLLPLPLRDLI